MSLQNPHQIEIADNGWLESVHQQWVATLDAIRDAIVVVDEAGIVLRANQSFATLAGAPFADIVQSSVANALPWAVDQDGALTIGTVVSPDKRYFAIRRLSAPSARDATIFILEDTSSQYLLEVAEETHRQGWARSHVDTVYALSNALQAKDPYTVSHNARVADLSKRIALKMGCDDVTSQGVFYGALVHDIGKLSIPSGILSKPGRLAQVEINLVRTHCEAGYAIVQHLDFPWPVHEVILQHHERLDGSGYPNGLRGNAIHPAAQVVAVADVVEAMMSHRPYRAALGIDVALAEIQDGRGLKYDADVVDACCAVVSDDPGGASSLPPPGYRPGG